MKWFLNLSTRNKLFLGFGLIIAFLATVIVIAYQGIATIQAAQQKLYQEEFANAVDMMTLRSNENGVRASLLSMLLVSKRSDQEIWHKNIKERSKEISGIAQRLLERNRNNSLLYTKLEEVRTIREAFAQTRNDQVIPLIYAGKAEQAKTILLGIQDERYLKIRAISQELSNAAVEKAHAAVVESELAAERTQRLFVMVGVAAMLLAVAMALLISRIIAIPLQMISGIAGKVASGDLTVSIPAGHRTDEIGELLRAFGAMLEGLRKLMREINEGVGVLASSSSEILATTTQVAAVPPRRRLR